MGLFHRAISRAIRLLSNLEPGADLTQALPKKPKRMQVPKSCDEPAPARRLRYLAPAACPLGCCVAFGHRHQGTSALRASHDAAAAATTTTTTTAMKRELKRQAWVVKDLKFVIALKLRKLGLGVPNILIKLILHG